MLRPRRKIWEDLKITADGDCSQEIKRRLLLIPVYVFWGGCWRCMHAELLQWYLTLCRPMDCRLPDSSVHGIFQARILEWVAMLSSRGSSRPRDWTHLSWVFCIASGFFTAESLGKPIEGRTHLSMWSYKLNVNTVWDGRWVKWRSHRGHRESAVGTAQRKVSIRGVTMYTWNLMTTVLCASSMV